MEAAFYPETSISSFSSALCQNQEEYNTFWNKSHSLFRSCTWTNFSSYLTVLKNKIHFNSVVEKWRDIFSKIFESSEQDISRVTWW